ncbi:MAG: hypothetical protein ACREHC_02350 [Candidatus Levyibacteriota bacterium]
MTERVDREPSEYDSEALRAAISEVDSLSKFVALVKEKLPHVPVEAFLYDFGAQFDLVMLMEQYSHQTRTDKETPVVILKEPGKTHADRETIGGTNAIEPHRFRLQDKEHIYFFNQLPQGDPLEVRFMDPETQVFPEQKSLIYPVNRVPSEGGLAERYNYGAKLWEVSGQGIYRGEGIGNLRIDGTLRLPRVYDRRSTY